MSLPPDDIAPFAARRRRLMDHMRAAGGGIAILPTAPQACAIATPSIRTGTTAISST